MLKRFLVVSLLLLTTISQAKTLTDIRQRQVVIPDNPQRIVIGEGRMIYTLALVEEGNPLKRVVGWPADLQHFDKQTWNSYVARFPDIARIPIIGQSNFADISIEKVIALHPDVVILPVYAKKLPNQDQLELQLDQAHIPLVYVDFRVDQLNNTVPSLRILGEVLDDQPKAEKFIAFYRQHMAVISDRLKAAPPANPSVMLQLHLGRRAECCTTVGHGNLADLITFAGGRNIAAGKFPAVFGQISPEVLITANPDIYLATGMAGPDTPESLQLGPQVSRQSAQQSFVQSLSKDAIISGLPAVRNGKTYAVWQNLYLSPWHLLVAEFFAKTFHPEIFDDVDPQRTLDEMNRDFLTVKETGTFWTGVKASPF